MTRWIESARVLRNTRITERLRWCEYEAPLIAAGARPGQFAHVLCSTPDQLDPLLRRPLSFSRIEPDRGQVAFLIDTVGRGTSWLVNRPIGTEIDMLGPLGGSFDFQPDRGRALMVGGGIGLAPLIALADLAPAQGVQVRLLAGGRDAHQVTPREWLDSSVDYRVATDDGALGHHGYVTDLVPDQFGWCDQIFVCGPTPMMRAMAELTSELAAAHGPRPAFTSLEARMGCAIGVCYSCVVQTTTGPRRVCHDGPVFPQSSLTWTWDHVPTAHPLAPG